MENSYIINIDQRTTSTLYQSIFDLASSSGIAEGLSHILTTACLLIGTFLLLAILDYLMGLFFNSIVSRLIKRSRTQWDNHLIDNRVNVHLSRLILLGICQKLLPLVFVGFPSLNSGLAKLLDIFMIFAGYSLLNGLFKSLRDILRSSRTFVDKPLDSYLQVLQIFLLFVGGTLAVSIITGNSPWSFLVSLGAASAVLMLVFKDTILGFVASIQVSANDSVRVGDWIEMPKYGADGDVLQINLNNVRIQNWDKTIVTVPTHTLLSDSFKNFRGMQESGGRRIKRAINIKISTIRYLAPQELETLKKISILSEYIEKRQQEIKTFNAENGIDPEMPVNGRRITNIGLFRAYIKAYVMENPNIHQKMTAMVRQLPATQHGLPLELYMFTKGTQWTFYEDVISDLFDHLLASIKYFGLEVFELPASDDLRYILKESQGEGSRAASHP